ncbi:ABC transporter ATP-binding protein [Ureaplasma canigenitalium]|uniref:ABC transporter ATP-binding protein n=1 Tax=Ureaplasma canigenitalium TaxID=42092 RepID=UPI00068D4108
MVSRDPVHKNENILEVIDLTKIYKRSTQGVRNLTFSIKKGDIHAFVGENGAGKTTTIKTIINAYADFQGKILIDGYDNRLPESKSKLGYVPEVALFPQEITTYEYLFSLARLSRVSAKEAKEKILYLLDTMGILNLKDKKPVNFSSGQKKKVLLIQALLHNPELIILDEPAANLDPSARFEFFEILKELNREGKTIFLCSHILKEADEYANSLTLIHGGKLVYTGVKYADLDSLYYNLILKDQAKDGRKMMFSEDSIKKDL